MDFLESPTGAPQCDNLSLRMLLRPHPMIPDVGFIDPRNDEALVELAFERLRLFSFIDVIENPDFESNLANWLGFTIQMPRLNQAPIIQPDMRRDLLAELTDTAFDALHFRSRLDLKLWIYVLARRAPGIDCDELRQRTIIRKFIEVVRSLG